MAVHRPALIAGGGIGGLATALALSRVGRSSVVLERRPAFDPEGAGIQIGPNGVHALRMLGVADLLQPSVGLPSGIEIRDGRKGSLLASLPLGPWLAARHGAPYWVAHRGDLHAALLAAVADRAEIEIRNGCEVASAEDEGAAVRATCASGDIHEGSILVGADGVWSGVRRCIAPDVSPQFVGATATRTVVAADRAGPLARPVVGLWLTPGVHIVHYPVRQGQEIAVVIITAEAWQATDWNAHADTAGVHNALAGFHSDIASVLTATHDWRKWSLNLLPELPRWTAGRIALMGDAAHPMLPYLAQGGVMALEDAVVLAGCLAASGDDAQGLQRFEALRRPRARRVQALSRRNGRVYHLAPPLSWARDAVLRASPATRLMAGLDWLYGWKPESAP